MTRLNLGCGLKGKAGYVNVDCRKLQGVDVCQDVMTLDYPEASVEEVFAEDFLEHLCYSDAQTLMDRVHRWLKEGGQLVVEGVPNLTALAVLMTQDYSDGMHHSIVKYLYGMDGIGDGAYPENAHRWGYTAKTLRSLVESSGLQVVSMGVSGDSLRINVVAVKA